MEVLILLLAFHCINMEHATELVTASPLSGQILSERNDVKLSLFD